MDATLPLPDGLMLSDLGCYWFAVSCVAGCPWVTADDIGYALSVLTGL